MFRVYTRSHNSLTNVQKCLTLVKDLCLVLKFYFLKNRLDSLDSFRESHHEIIL